MSARKYIDMAINRKNLYKLIICLFIDDNIGAYKSSINIKSKFWMSIRKYIRDTDIFLINIVYIYKKCW
jgi:hypothetical protein